VIQAEAALVAVQLQEAGAVQLVADAKGLAIGRAVHGFDLDDLRTHVGE